MHATASPTRQYAEASARPESARPMQQTLAPAAPFPLSTLSVGAVGDREEVAADRRADEVMERLHAGGTHNHVHRNAGGSPGAIGLAGGTLDAEADRRIEARRGRGERLASDVRRSFEDAFGNSFADVTVHRDAEADRLSRHLSATAFTTGSDIFFSRGAYRPGDPGGDRLLAHELAHVEQGDGAARRTIRRAVGFEFETNIIVMKNLVTVDDDPETWDLEAAYDSFRAVESANATLVPYPKQAVLRQYPGFRMEADQNSISSNIEFVVDPPLPETGRGRLLEIMTAMVAEAKKIHDMRNDPRARAATEARPGRARKLESDWNEKAKPLLDKADRLREERQRNGMPSTEATNLWMAEKRDIPSKIGRKPIVQDEPSLSFLDVGITGGDRAARLVPAFVQANPQVTGGIAMDRLLRVQQQLGATGDRTGLSGSEARGASQLHGRAAIRSPAIAAGLIATALKTHPTFAGLREPPSEELKGVVAILASYLLNGSKAAGGPLSYAKLISGSMMMRTDLGTVVEDLPSTEPAEIFANAAAFADWVLTLTGMAGAAGDLPVFERGVLADYADGVGSPLDVSPSMGLTRRQWLVGLAAGVDNLSSDTMPAERDRLEGLGRLGPRTDQVAGGTDRASSRAPVVEFRGMADGVPHDRWAEVALQTFDYIVATNRR